MRIVVAKVRDSYTAFTRWAVSWNGYCLGRQCLRYQWTRRGGSEAVIVASMTLVEPRHITFRIRLPPSHEAVRLKSLSAKLFNDLGLRVIF